jgi:D-alanyl-D-alanine carboxypeptidase
MKNIFSLLAAIILLVSCQTENLIPATTTCNPDTEIAVTANHPKQEAIQALMDKYVGKGLPGMTILISDDNGTWYGSAGYADLENGVLMQPCHINKLGSITKMMMGALIWQLIQEGKLAIDEPIQTYVPELAERLPYGSEITLGMLLSHTSGLYDIARDLEFNLAVINDFSRSWTEEEILQYIDGKSPTHAPGEAVRYSNTNTLVEGLIVEAVTGRQHGELLRERIFQPLDMSQTVYYGYSGNFPFDYVAQGYLDFHNDGGDIQNISQLNPGSGNSYTGVYSTVTDLYRFMNALLREKTLITPENLDFIFNNMLGEEDASWFSSYGAIHNEQRDHLPADTPAYGHGGGDIGYSANLAYFPNNNTIWAATYNYGTNLPSELGEVLDELRQELYLLMAE